MLNYLDKYFAKRHIARLAVFVNLIAAMGVYHFLKAYGSKIVFTADNVIT